MKDGTPLSRRNSLKIIAAGGALLGSGAIGVSATLPDSGVDTEEDGHKGSDTGATDIDPDAIQLVAQCVDADRAYATFRIDNDADEPVTLTPEGAPLYDDDDGFDGGDNDAAIEEINSILEEINAKLENVEDIEPIEEITESTADDLQDEIFTQVVAEINAQSQDILGQDIANEVSTPAEAREEADRIEDEWGPAAQDAIDALNNAADHVETIQDIVADALEDGGGSDGLDVDPNGSTQFKAELDSNCTATVALRLDGEIVAEATADYDELEAC